MSDDKRLERIEDKLDLVTEKIASIDVTLEKQHQQLAYHIERTNLLEKKLEPVEKHVTMVHGVLKFIGLIGILFGIAEAFFKIIGK